ncbi:DUF1176 domain-containing protein [Luteimonas sp. S4-F44]|uniref:DUF1176 domain-containing protein n=1 Tax=Luteimonas sp. S4-F44 TaxID=2925842 RepID=UPI001F53119A|nr:DUF1176 domain-containing protein [Luteimonas sp. S4-F44]UNK42937.1 DUF1176 domain-containing protein [Luteimonas sp. S4-F44]
MSVVRPLVLACVALLAACAEPAPPATPDTAVTASAPSTVPATAVHDADTTAGAARSAVAPLYRQLHDFTVACDNGLACEAIGVNDGAFGLVLRLSRAPGGDGAQRLQLGTADGTPEPASLRLDGVAVPELAVLPWRRDDDRAALTLDVPADISAFIARVGNGARLSAGSGEDAPALSLSGLRAALLLIDEHQQRLDTPSAWARPGERDSAAVPGAPALPRVHAAPPPPALSLQDATRLTVAVRMQAADALREADCASPGEGVDMRSQDAAYPLDAEHALVFVACLSGAYQTSSLAFRAVRDGSGAARIVPPGPPGLDGTSSGFALLTNADYAPDTATLSHFAKGRGLADCGEAAQWRYDGQAFQLAHYAELRRCGGAAPGDFPTLWRTETAR